MTTPLDLVARIPPGRVLTYGAIAAHLAEASGRASPRLVGQIAGRGACAHPDGVIGLVASATRVFNREFEAHLSGRCTAHGRDPVLPIPAPKRSRR